MMYTIYDIGNFMIFVYNVQQKMFIFTVRVFSQLLEDLKSHPVLAFPCARTDFEQIFWDSVSSYLNGKVEWLLQKLSSDPDICLVTRFFDHFGDHKLCSTSCGTFPRLWSNACCTIEAQKYLSISIQIRRKWLFPFCLPSILILAVKFLSCVFF